MSIEFRMGFFYVEQFINMISNKKYTFCVYVFKNRFGKNNLKLILSFAFQRNKMPDTQIGSNKSFFVFYSHVHSLVMKKATSSQ